MKVCFKCSRELPLTEFYKHKEMADGHLGKCKDCTRADVNAYRLEHPEITRERKAAWAKTESGKATSRRTNAKRMLRNPDQVRAVTMVGNAIKLGKLVRQPCFMCGMEPAEAHHSDYSLPLAVTWLCKKHHVEVHQMTKQLRRRASS